MTKHFDAQSGENAAQSLSMCLTRSINSTLQERNQTASSADDETQKAIQGKR